MFAAVGIQHLVSPPYTLQHIASIERRHRHVVEMSLTLLHDASLPLSLWSFAFNVAVYLIYRLPTSILDNKSPLECLFHSQPNYSKLRAFGCLSYPWLRRCTNNKLEQHFKLCIFLGHFNTHDSYICFESTNHKIYFSRHVYFIESHFPSLLPLHERDKIINFTLTKWAMISPFLKSFYLENPSPNNPPILWSLTHSNLAFSPTTLTHNQSYISRNIISFLQIHVIILPPLKIPISVPLPFLYLPYPNVSLPQHMSNLSQCLLHPPNLLILTLYALATICGYASSFINFPKRCISCFLCM